MTYIDKLRQTLSMLDSMIQGGETHSKKSAKQLGEAYGILDKIDWQPLNEKSKPTNGEEAIFINEKDGSKELSSFGQTMPPKYYFDCYTHWLKL